MTMNSSDRGSDVDHVGCFTDHCHPWRMRKILILLPLITLLTGCGPSAKEKAEALKLELLEVCKDDLRDVLKDPQSLRVLSYGSKFYDEVRPPKYFDNGELMWGETNVGLTFDYTATNSYGGRIRNNRLCLFLDRDLVWSG